MTPPLPDDIRTTFFTVANRPYEHFVLPYIVSVLIHNDDSRVEICVEDPKRFMKENKKALRVLKQHTASSRYLIRKGDFRAAPPESVRFLETPEVRTEYVYIADIDAVILGKITDDHVSTMSETGLPYANVIQGQPNVGTVLSGWHFTRFDAFYPVSIPEGTDVFLDRKLLYDMICAKGHGLPPWLPPSERKGKERHAIHISPNQFPTPDIREKGGLNTLDAIRSRYRNNGWQLKNYRALWNNGVWREMFPLFDPRYKATIAIVELCIANVEMSESGHGVSMKAARTLARARKAAQRRFTSVMRRTTKT